MFPQKRLKNKLIDNPTEFKKGTILTKHFVSLRLFLMGLITVQFFFLIMRNSISQQGEPKAIHAAVYCYKSQVLFEHTKVHAKNFLTKSDSFSS